ncbi:hypothetical protein [Burkholderia stagnalis]|uniref:hypothetical protein n=1 Tax=Burkholderia stagnalis TaxID=1503054 RepID=UPI0012D99472|nr:hypothetical protein [Burkholderia stagnalis]
MPTISIRLSDAQKIELEERSASYGGNVSDYVKDALFGTGQERGREILARLDELAEQVSRASGRPARGAPSAPSDETKVMLSEALILLRMSLRPEAMRAARAELERLKIEPWEPADAAKENNRG